MVLTAAVSTTAAVKRNLYGLYNKAARIIAEKEYHPHICGPAHKASSLRHHYRNLVIGSKTSRDLCPFLTSCKPFFAHARSQRMTTVYAIGSFGRKCQMKKIYDGVPSSPSSKRIRSRKRSSFPRKSVYCTVVHFPFFIYMYQNRMNLNNLSTCQAQPIRYNSVSLGWRVTV